RRYNKFKRLLLDLAEAQGERGAVAASDDRGYRNPIARKSSCGSSKLQLPKEVTNFRRSRSLLMSIFHSRHAKNSSVKENESAFSSSSMSAACRESHLYSAASTAAPSTLRNPCIFVFTSSRNMRSGRRNPAVNWIGTWWVAALTNDCAIRNEVGNARATTRPVRH